VCVCVCVPSLTGDDFVDDDDSDRHEAAAACVCVTRPLLVPVMQRQRVASG
jgi:hypothetical protein